MSFVELTPWQIFLKGGAMMWPILFCWMGALAISIERALIFFSFEREFYQLRERVTAAVQRNALKDAVQLCDDEPMLPLSPVLRAGLLKAGSGREEDIRRAMEDAAGLEVPALEKGLTVLRALASIAPLLGFLGTIIAMASVFRLFEVRAVAMNPSSPAELASGVWAALIPAAAGLLVAIPLGLMSNYLFGRVLILVREMELASGALADMLAGRCHPSKDGEDA